MQTKKQTNYSPELTNKLIQLYEQYGTENIAEIAKIIEKPEKSVIAKLVKLNLYKPVEKPVTRKTGKSKKEIINELETLVGFDCAGLLSAAKPTLQNLLNYINSSIK